MPNYSRAHLDRLRQLINEAEDLPRDQINAWRQRAALAVTSLYGEGSSQLGRFEDIRWSLSFWTDNMPERAFIEAERRGLQQARDMLSAMIEDVEAHTAKPELPGLDPAAMHPCVHDAASRLWADGHQHQAVQAAAAAVETRLRTKTGAHAGSAASLASSAFSLSPPAADHPRLRFDNVGPEESDSWKSAHEGAGAFGRGCMLRIRNLYTHNAGATEMEALEALGALSLLARWIDMAQLRKAPESLE